MSLLPGGERGSRLYQAAFAVFVITAGYQGFLYVHAVSAADNIVTLADDIALNGEDHYRRELAHILELNSLGVDPAAIAISFDRESGVYDVTVPARWTLDLPWKHLELNKTFHQRVRPRADLFLTRPER